MKKIIELLKKENHSLPLVDYTGLGYFPHYGFKVFQIYKNEESNFNHDRVTLWISKHYWNPEDCSLNDFITEVECSAYMEDFPSVEDAIYYLAGSDFKTLIIDWKNSESELEKACEKIKKTKNEYVFHIAPYKQELFLSKLEEILDEKTFRLLTLNYKVDEPVFKPLENSQIVLEDEMILECNEETSKPKLVEYYLELFEGIEERYVRKVEPDETVNGYVLVDVLNEKGIKIYFTILGDETYDDDFKVFLTDEEKEMIYQKAFKKFKED